MNAARLARLTAGALTALTLTTTAVVALPTAAYAVAQCGDGIDNDGDGNTDYPSDIGCGSASDSTEGVPCSVTSGLTACAGINAAATVQRVRVYNYNVVDGPTHHAAGYVDLYRFVLPGGPIVNLPCVVLIGDATTVDPCDENGGSFVSRVSVLVDETVAEPRVEQGTELTNVGLCEGELVLTVQNIGIASAPAYTLC